jgi:hypothetical protein
MFYLLKSRVCWRLQTDINTRQYFHLVQSLHENGWLQLKHVVNSIIHSIIGTINIKCWINSLTGAYSPGWTFGFPFSGFLYHTHTDTWTSDQPVTETSTYTGQHNKHPCPERNSNPRPQQPSCRRPTPYTARPLGSASNAEYIMKMYHSLLL